MTCDIIIPKVMFNPNTLKVMYNPETSKVLVHPHVIGCLKAYGVDDECESFPANETPNCLKVEFSGIRKCADGELWNYYNKIWCFEQVDASFWSDTGAGGSGNFLACDGYIYLDQADALNARIFRSVNLLDLSTLPITEDNINDITCLGGRTGYDGSVTISNPWDE